MRFLMLYKPALSEAELAPPTEEEVARMGAFMDEYIKAGILLAAEGCLPSALGARVRQTAGAVKVTDGPFAEAKELIGGFALMRAGSKDEAIGYARQFLAVAGDGEVEVRQVYDTPACDLDVTPATTSA
jgi:hypothetical protein